MAIKKAAFVFVSGFIGMWFIDIIAEILSNKLHMQLWNNSFLPSEWRNILLGMIILMIVIIDALSKLNNKDYKDKMIISAKTENKRTKKLILVILTIFSVVIFAYNKSVTSFKYAAALSGLFTIILSDISMTDGVIKEGLIYNNGLIKWEDIISYKWEGTFLKMEIYNKKFGYKYKKNIGLKIKDKDMWNEYLCNIKQ